MTTLTFDASTEPALSGRHLTVRLGESAVLSGVHVEVRPGEVVALLGPSGAGKSTLLRVLAGELAPSGGVVRLGPSEVTAQPLWRRARAGLGYLPQTPSVLFDLTVADNLRTFARLCGAAELEPGERLARVGLEPKLLGLRARELSGGERRRLELLRVLLPRPKVMLLDEPLGGLDPGLAERVGRVLREEADRGAAVLVADHRVVETLGFADRAALLLDGRIELWASPAEFLDHPAVQARYLG
ncbi:MAG: ATP-binding cassette domain-containing protein [Polyangiaceae bacterium]|nr:ATP-binding cassette domain-containing protein [Polyangiaceae bacterium]